MHWHQPHTWSEITRAGLATVLSEDAERASWYVGDERRTGTIAERDAIADVGWRRFVEGVEHVPAEARTIRSTRSTSWRASTG